MTQFPAGTISFRVYEDSVNEVGVAKVTLPDITNKTITLLGSGMMGDVSVPIMGMIENMTMGMDFLTYAQPTIVKMVDTGLIGGTGTGAKDENNRPADLDLSMDMIRTFVVHDRAGLYDKRP